MMPGNTQTQGKRQQGFTLLEVLIALLVLAIGLLGLAALQTTGLRSNTMATTRTHATQLAYDIADRMRANVAGSYATGTNNFVIDTPNGYGLANCSSAPTDSTIQANDDLITWCSAVTNMLPGGDAKITQTIDAGVDKAVGTPVGALDDVVSYEVTVYWDEARTGAKGTGCDPLNRDDLRCMKLNVTIPRPIPNV